MLPGCFPGSESRARAASARPPKQRSRVRSIEDPPVRLARFQSGWPRTPRRARCAETDANKRQIRGRPTLRTPFERQLRNVRGLAYSRSLESAHKDPRTEGRPTSERRLSGGPVLVTERSPTGPEARNIQDPRFAASDAESTRESASTMRPQDAPPSMVACVRDVRQPTLQGPRSQNLASRIGHLAASKGGERHGRRGSIGDSPEDRLNRVRFHPKSVQTMVMRVASADREVSPAPSPADSTQSCPPTQTG